MIDTTVKLSDKTITVWERRGMFGRLVIHEQKIKFDQDCKTLLTLFAKFAKVNKLPKNSQEIIEAIGASYQNCSDSFVKRKPYVVVVDVDKILNQLIK